MHWASGASGRSLTLDDTISSQMVISFAWLNNLHFPPSSREDVFHCLDIQLVWMGRQMRTKYCLSPHWSSGEELQGDRAPTGSKASTMTWPRLTWSCQKQLRIDLSGECWLHIALRTHSGAC